MVKEVLVIFKTHLDIGFCDLGQAVTDRYLTEFIPNAIKRGYELKDTDTPYLWTTGSWLIYEALKQDTDGKVEQAIRDGLIAWHGLPFTTFTECMNKELFLYGLSLSQELDRRFSKTTIAAKMSDVPGQTKAMIPYMARAGIEFLHLGVNPAYQLPPIPPLCRWQNGEDEIILMMQSDYGNTMEFEDFVITFGFTHDNKGPQSVEEIKQIYADLRAKYPHAHIHAATLSDAAEKLRSIRHTLPVVTHEIGDLWIQNVGTDPKKVSVYRELLRSIEKEGVKSDLTDSLLLIPEHTWGGWEFMFPDFETYLFEDFKQVPKEKRALYEQSWQEKRDYTTKACKALGIEIPYRVDRPDVSRMQEIPLPPLDFEVSWQLFDNTDYARFIKGYMKEDMQGVEWVWQDNTKFGLPDYQGGIYPAVPRKAYTDGEQTVIELAFDEAVTSQQGLPQIVAIVQNNRIEIRWFGQQANRLPQAYWFKWKGLEESHWRISKLGQWINADEVVYSPLLAATDFGVQNRQVRIESLDTSLVAPYGRKLLNVKTDDDKQDLYFNLYNNIWGCNHPMWYDEDSRFRFVLHQR